ncbi:MAG: hypothetical protein ACLT8Y_01730 [Dorea formicigenerans]
MYRTTKRMFNGTRKTEKRAGNLSRTQVWEDDRVLVYLEECRKKQAYGLRVKEIL